MSGHIKTFLKEKFSTLYFFYQYIGKKLYLVFGFSSLMVLMDSVGLALFIPLLHIADSSSSSSAIGSDNDKIKDIVTSVFNYLGLNVNMPNMLLLIILIFILKSLFFYLANKFNAVAQQTVLFKMRTRLANSIKDLSYQEFVMTDVGRLQNSVLSEVWHVINGCMHYMDALKNMLFVAIYLGFAFYMDWRFSILVMLGGVLTNWIYKYFYKRTQELSRNITKNNHQYGGTVIEVINHFKYFKATGRNISFFAKLQSVLDELIRNNITVAKLSAKLSAIREPMTIAVICAVIYVHVVVFDSSLSSVMIILLFFYRVMQKIVDIQTGWNSYLTSIGSIENMMDFQSYLDNNKDVFYGGDRDIDSINVINLRHLSVSYGDIRVLDGINLEVKKNQSIAFVGESGSGKTTLVNVLSTLLPYDSGEFTINGVGIRECNNTIYKSKIGYISQEPTIFNGSIFENVTFWADRNSDSIEKFNKVIDMCSLRSFINSLSEGEDTLLGNNGLNISGGQKQRISIARELYRDVELLIMDEATSALDSETENVIKESIESIQGSVTIISIAHRLSTIRNVDCIYLLEKGKITAEGDFLTLKNKSEYFKKLTYLQGV